MARVRGKKPLDLPATVRRHITNDRVLTTDVFQAVQSWGRVIFIFGSAERRAKVHEEYVEALRVASQGYHSVPGGFSVTSPAGKALFRVVGEPMSGLPDAEAAIQES